MKFKEMEYAIPREHVTETLHEIDRWMKKSGTNVAFPVEVRFAAADDLWLSTAHGRDTAYIAVHQYHRRPETEYFAAVEAIARAVDGRPHWGKMHNRTVETCVLRTTDSTTLSPFETSTTRIVCSTTSTCVRCSATDGQCRSSSAFRASLANEALIEFRARVSRSASVRPRARPSSVKLSSTYPPK